MRRYIGCWPGRSATAVWQRTRCRNADYVRAQWSSLGFEVSAQSYETRHALR
jgi:hypothetical protein